MIRFTSNLDLYSSIGPTWTLHIGWSHVTGYGYNFFKFDRTNGILNSYRMRISQFYYWIPLFTKKQLDENIKGKYTIVN